jgi:tetratricopeptide (TPR) repeat protein
MTQILKPMNPRNPKRRCIVALQGICFAAAIIAGTELSAEDTVILKAKEGRGTTRSVGEVIEFSGKQLLLRRAGDRDETIDTRRVLDVQTTLEPDHRTGDEFFASGDFEQALASYEKAFRSEKRAWVQRRIRAQIAWCQRNTGQLGRSLDTFMFLIAFDSTIQFFDAMPVLWVAEPIPPSLEKRVRPMIGDPKLPEATKLIVTSWLLPTAHRPAALKVLQDLTGSEDQRIAFWAEAQIWRTQAVTASPEIVERWRAVFSRMPFELQAGPAFVLGQAYSRLKQPEEAALFFMRAPILQPLDRGLACQALLAAGQELETMDQVEEAANVYREIVSKHGNSSAAAIARDRLEKRKKP